MIINDQVLTFYLYEMQNSLLGWYIIEPKLTNPKWIPTLSALDPTDEVKFDKKIYSEFDQPKIAVAIALLMKKSRFA